MTQPGKYPAFTPEWWELWSMPEPNTGCHLWMGCVCKQGYGRVYYNGRGGFPVHRARYESTVGPVPPDLKVCHRCDVRSCVNPDHLFLGTQKDNLRDMFAKKRGRPQGRDYADRKAQILELLAKNPTIRLGEIARQIGLSYSYVQRLVKDEGLPVVMQRGRAAPRRQQEAAA